MDPGSLLEEVVQSLAAAAPDDLDSLILAELLWLLPRLPKLQQAATTQEVVNPKPSPGPLPRHPPGPTPSPDGGNDKPSEEPGKPDENDQPPPSPEPIPLPPEPLDREEMPMAALLPDIALPSAEDAAALLPVWLEDPPLLSDSLTLLRALMPLQGRAASSWRTRLNEQATVEAYVETLGLHGEGGWLCPVLEPLPEPQFDLVFLVDGGVAMGLWDRLVNDLVRALGSCAVFRDLKMVRLLPSGEVPAPLKRWCRADPENRRLMLLLSDCCGDHWWSGSMAEQLAAWGATGPMAVVQVLPGWMWERTALGFGDPLVLRNRVEASASSRYAAARQRWLSEAPEWLVACGSDASSAVQVPVVACEPRALAEWSLVVMGKPAEACTGFLLPTTEALASGEALDGQVEDEEEEEDGEPGDGLVEAAVETEELLRLRRFQALASPMARRLHALLAAAPVLTLPVIRLVRQALLVNDRTPLATAEVLLGGALELMQAPAPGAFSSTPTERLQFTMAPEVRRELLKGVDGIDAVTVLNAVSRLVEERWNRFMPRGSFRAFLTDPDQRVPEGFSGMESFARVAADIIDQLGDDYRPLAERLRQGARKHPVVAWPAEEFTFQEESVETAAVFAIPPVETIPFTTARFQEVDLHQISFQTAKVVIERGPQVGFRAINEGWGKAHTKIKRTSATTWAFFEPLQRDGLLPGAVAHAADPLTLTMVEIPEGGFQMGSPRGEPDRFNNESPQYRVHLEGFFLSQTPITQAQWRAVANWQPRPEEGESWGRKLDPAPSHFQGKGARLLEGESNTDQRPVDRVSWHDANEFCSRLSQITGRHYTLPSEAQWEYACRARTTKPFHFGDTITTDLANYGGTSSYGVSPKGEFRHQTTPVGSFPANPWGLEDMHGNVWEWCLDTWHDSYKGSPRDGSAWLDPEAGEDIRRLLRGGSWSHDPRDCRSAFRGHGRPVSAGSRVGFRVVCLPPGPS